MQQRSPLHSINEQVTPKETNIQVKSECILFSQSVMSGYVNDLFFTETTP